MVDVGNLI